MDPLNPFPSDTPIKVIGCRPALIGDTVMSAVVIEAIKRLYPKAYVNWVVAAKCSQAAPLYINHPAIDRILVTESSEGYGPRELAIAKDCQMAFNPMPQHQHDGWPRERNIYEETWTMAGLPLDWYHSLPKEHQYPHLYPWFTLDKRPKCVAIWPGARQGEKENRRVPPYEWWAELCEDLAIGGYTIYQCGHPNDLKGKPLLGIDVRERSFIDLIRLSLECDCVIGTDSGSMVALAAYGLTSTISMLSPHWPGHGDVNPHAFGPLGPRHINLWAPSNEAHSVQKVLDTLKQLV